MSRTVRRALAILELLGDGEARLVDLSERLGQHKSTVQRLLSTMEEAGFVRQDPDTKRYFLGLKILELASKTLANLDIRDAAEGPMAHLSEVTGETIHLAVYDEPQIVYVHKVESTYPVRMYSKVGAAADAHCTGVGKAIVAFLDADQLNAYLEICDLKAYTPRTITTQEALQEEFEQIRVRGYALDHQEHEEGVQCIGVPVFGADGTVMGAVSVAAPAFRKSIEEIEGLASLVINAAREISANLGGQYHTEDGQHES